MSSETVSSASALLELLEVCRQTKGHTPVLSHNPMSDLRGGRFNSTSPARPIHLPGRLLPAIRPHSKFPVWRSPFLLKKWIIIHTHMLWAHHAASYEALPDRHRQPYFPQEKTGHKHGLWQGWAIIFAREPHWKGRVGRYLFYESRSKSQFIASALIFTMRIWENVRFEDFPGCFCGPLKTLWRATFGPRAAICPPLVYSDSTEHAHLLVCPSCARSCHGDILRLKCKRLLVDWTTSHVLNYLL